MRIRRPVSAPARLSSLLGRSAAQDRMSVGLDSLDRVGHRHLLAVDGVLAAGCLYVERLHVVGARIELAHTEV